MFTGRCNLCPRFSSTLVCSPCSAKIDRAKTLLLRPVVLHLAHQFAERDRIAFAASKPQINESDVKPTPEPAGEGDTAVSGREGIKAEELLKTAKEKAVKTLAAITRAAVLRLLADPRWLRSARGLYSQEEKRQLTELLAATSATANLLGRARIRGRINKPLSQFSEVWLQFADGPPLKPMAPEAALAYFKGLQPGIDQDPQRFGNDQRRRAFTLADITEATLLSKVKGIVAGGLESGESTTGLALKVNEVLKDAGVHPKNPQRAEMIIRTNIMDAYQVGQMDEMQQPDMREFFPVWRYDAIVDQRSRPDHAARDGKYYPNATAFGRVRGNKIGDMANCRCQPTPVSAPEWEDLVAAGAHVEPGYGSVEQPKLPYSPLEDPINALDEIPLASLASK